MVLNISGGEESTEEEEPSGIEYGTTDEEFIDSDMSDVSHGSVIANPRITSLFTTQRSWRVLRLPGGRAGEEGPGGLRGFTNFMLQIIPGWRGQTIRDSPFRQMVTARMWQQYINNMEPIDDALELQAPYSPEELLSLRMFCEEWVNDPGHVRFTRRLANHPSTNASDAVLKGNMVYDLCTGQIQLRTSRGARGDGNIPIRMAHDILTSIPFQEYNFYTLNSVHPQEGAAVYEGFLNRYIRLSSTEVAMTEEIEQGIRSAGRGYATMSTNITGDPIEAYALMQQTVEAMELGDTVSVRAHLNALLSPPYNYKSMAQQIDVAGTHGGRFVANDQIRYVNINLNATRHMGDNSNNAPFAGNRRQQIMVYAQGRGKSGELVMWPEGPHSNNRGHPPLGYYMRVNDNGIGVHSVLEVFDMGGQQYIRVADQDDQALQISQMVGGFNRRDRERRDTRPDREGRADRDAADRRRGVREGGSRTNPHSPPSAELFGKKVEISPVPKTTNKKGFSIVFNEGERDWLDYFILMALGTKTKAWCKKNANSSWPNTIVGQNLEYHAYYKKVLPKRAEDVAQAFKLGGHKLGKDVEYVILGRAIYSIGNEIIGPEVAGDLLEKGLDNLSVIADARSNPHESHVMSIGGMDHTFSVPTSFKADVRRFGGETTMGRGKFIYVQILPKTQVEFTGKHKGTRKQTQYWEQGGTKVSDKTGLAKVFPGGPDVKNPGYFIKTAIHKRTGAVVPWLIGLPRDDFQAFTDSEGRRTLRPKRRKAEANPAWAKFERFYGIPSYKGGKGKQNLFAIKSADKGQFYDDLRAKPTKR